MSYSHNKLRPKEIKNMLTSGSNDYDVDFYLKYYCEDYFQVCEDLHPETEGVDYWELSEQLKDEIVRRLCEQFQKQ